MLKVEHTFLAGGGLSPSAPSAAGAPLGSSASLRFLPLEDFGLSSLPSPFSSLSLSAFFTLGLVAFFTTGSGFGISLIREERRGSAAPVPPSVAAAALRGIVSVWAQRG